VAGRQWGRCRQQCRHPSTPAAPIRSNPHLKIPIKADKSEVALLAMALLAIAFIQIMCETYYLLMFLTTNEGVHGILVFQPEFFQVTLRF
jgi:hypothetical protein